MKRGAKERSLLVKRRYDEIVALHQHGRTLHAQAVVVVVAKSELPRLPVEAAPGTDDGKTLLAVMPVDAARAWLAGAEGLGKWDEPSEDAMDVAVTAAAGVSVMRLTARR